ncbi:MAG: PilZ domain-containing protein [Desulfuromonadaceae bacterium]|nr:PilZ domain-containing protein [Desulfuromonadaceae bacterium]MDD5107312.1 PilZ domain-containing protein [Desulfuromonadaceae bacterium]
MQKLFSQLTGWSRGGKNQQVEKTAAEVTRSLLGYQTVVVERVIGRKPDETVELGDGKLLLKYKDGPVREIHITDGIVTRCGYTEDKRKHPRITPAHFISIQISEQSSGSTQGMILDMSLDSIKVRLKERPRFPEKAQVAVEFCIPETKDIHEITIDTAVVLRTSGGDGIYHAVFLFDPFPVDHAYSKYIELRKTEMYMKSTAAK